MPPLPQGPGGRSELLGLPVDNERPTPRFFNNTRLGPIPLLAIEGVSGKTDPVLAPVEARMTVRYQPARQPRLRVRQELRAAA